MENLEINDKKVWTKPIISFGPEDTQRVSDPHIDALFIPPITANYELSWIFVDLCSSMNVLFKEIMNYMDLGEYKVEPVIMDLFGFTGRAVNLVKIINFPLYFGK